MTGKNNFMKNGLFVLIAFIGLISFSCNSGVKKAENVLDSTIAQGDLRVFYAGSMIIPMKSIISDFKKEYPHVNVHAEASGSRTAARKVIDKNRRCDVLISSDYQVIKNLMIPNYASWYIEFASNEMVIAYSDSSMLSDDINQDNWYKVLLNDSVHFGRANPDSDPCGHRTVISIKLAEKYYGEYGIKDNLLFKNKRFIKASDHELVDLLNKQEVDYVFIYKSVAKQEQLKFVTLPDQINLKLEKYASYYSLESTNVSGKNPGKYIKRKGDPIRYALTIVKNAPNPIAAEAFLSFFIDETKGLNILKENSMNVLDSLIVFPTDSTTIEMRAQFGL